MSSWQEWDDLKPGTLFKLITGEETYLKLAKLPKHRPDIHVVNLATGEIEWIGDILDCRMPLMEQITLLAAIKD